MLDKLIKKGKIFIVAEIGVNHEGDVLKALEMITLAKKSGADAVKFQTYLAESYVSSSQEERLERVKRFQLNFGQFRELSERAKEEGVIFFSTPLDLESLELLNRISSVIKVSSGDINNYPFLKEIASLKKPVILSTGLSGEAEITRAIDALSLIHI